MGLLHSQKCMRKCYSFKALTRFFWEKWKILAKDALI